MKENIAQPVQPVRERKLSRKDALALTGFAGMQLAGYGLAIFNLAKLTQVPDTFPVKEQPQVSGERGNAILGLAVGSVGLVGYAINNMLIEGSNTSANTIPTNTDSQGK